MTRKAFLKECPTGWLVGVRDKETDYSGPVAEISFDEAWFYICTDEHEGNAMINIEALPALRRALARLAKKIAAEKS